MRTLYIQSWLVWLLPFYVGAQPPDMEYLRQNYFDAVENKELCEHMIAGLTPSSDAADNTEDLDLSDNPALRAYLGGLQIIRARHVVNPLAKWRTFQSGKTNIEWAVSRDPDNMDIRAVRYSVQRGAPAFLGYRDRVGEDKAFLEVHRNEATSRFLRSNIDELLNAENP